MPFSAANEPVSFLRKSWQGLICTIIYTSKDSILLNLQSSQNSFWPPNQGWATSVSVLFQYFLGNIPVGMTVYHNFESLNPGLLYLFAVVVG